MIASTTPGTHYPRISAQTVTNCLREIGERPSYTIYVLYAAFLFWPSIASLWEKIYQFNTGVYILLGLGEEALTHVFLSDSSSITVRRPFSVSVSMPTSVTYVMVEISPLGRVIR